MVRLLVRLFGGATLVLVLLWGCVNLYWHFWPINVIDFHSVEIVRSEDVFHPGDVLQVDVVYTKYYNLPAIVYRSAISQTSGHMVDIPNSTTTDLPCGSHLRRRVVIKLPEFLPPDTYIIRSTSLYPINPSRYVHEYWETQPFTVTAE